MWQRKLLVSILFPIFLKIKTYGTLFKYLNLQKMEKSPDERPFLAVFKLRLASANYMATPFSSGWTESDFSTGTDLGKILGYSSVRTDPDTDNLTKI